MNRLSFLFWIFLGCACPIMAQTRINSETKAMSRLGEKDKRFTARDKSKVADILGLRLSDFTGTHHSIGLYVYGGYATVLSSTKDIAMTPGGGTAKLGALYEFRHDYFTLQTGLGTFYRHVTVNVGDYTYNNSMLAEQYDSRWAIVEDSWGTKLQYLQYDFMGRTDRMRQLGIEVPLLLGATMGHFYCLGGLTFSLPFYQKAQSEMAVTTTAKYSQYYGIWEEMDNHGYRRDVPLERTTSVKIHPDLFVSMDIGYNWYFKRKTQLRMGLYAECGLMNQARYADGPAIDVPYSSKWDFETFGMTPIWFSDDAKGKQLHNFSVGMRLTLFHVFPTGEKCILCGQHKKNR